MMFITREVDLQVLIFLVVRQLSSSRMVNIRKPLPPVRQSLHFGLGILHWIHLQSIKRWVDPGPLEEMASWHKSYY